MFLKVIYGNKPLPPQYEKLLSKIDHEKYIPQDLLNYHENEVLVINSDNTNMIKNLTKNSTMHIKLRLNKKDLNRLHNIFNWLIGKCKRLDLLLLHIDTYNDRDREIYQDQLTKITDIFIKQLVSGQSIELWFFPARENLGENHFCNPGTDHVTLAPDGKFYLCPAFYLDNYNPVGDLKTGVDITNEQIVKSLDPPTCLQCQDSHCRRCIYLNKTISYKFNIPSYQQCSVSLLELEIQKKIVQALEQKEKHIHPSNLPSKFDKVETHHLNKQSKVNSVDKHHLKQKSELKEVEKPATKKNKSIKTSDFIRLSDQKLRKLSIEELVHHIFIMQKEIQSLFQMKNPFNNH